MDRLRCRARVCFAALSAVAVAILLASTAMAAAAGTPYSGRTSQRKPVTLVLGHATVSSLHFEWSARCTTGLDYESGITAKNVHLSHGRATVRLRAVQHGVVQGHNSHHGVHYVAVLSVRTTVHVGGPRAAGVLSGGVRVSNGSGHQIDSCPIKGISWNVARAN